jgi:hypothetical protein
MNSEKILPVLWYIFDIVVMSKISFVPTIEFTYSTGGPLVIMSSPMSWKMSFFGCCPVPGESCERWIALWPTEFSLAELLPSDLLGTICPPHCSLTAHQLHPSIIAAPPSISVRPLELSIPFNHRASSISQTPAILISHAAYVHDCAVPRQSAQPMPAIVTRDGLGWRKETDSENKKSWSLSQRSLRDDYLVVKVKNITNSLPTGSMMVILKPELELTF